MSADALDFIHKHTVNAVRPAAASNDGSET